MDSGFVADKSANPSLAEPPQDATLFDFLIRVGFVVLSSVGAHPGEAHGPDG